MSVSGAIGVREEDLPWVDIGVRPGYNQRHQGFFDKKRKISARVGSLYAEPYYHSPRHRHTFQQVRYVLSGKMKYGKDVYQKDDCLYLPEGSYYGPIKPVDSGEQLHFADIQFDGFSGIPYPDPDEVIDAQKALEKIGTFKEGVYTFPDGRNRDAYEAILEKISGKKIEYPDPWLNGYTVIRTPKINWRPHESLKGVRIKDLALFFSKGPNLKLINIEKGNILPSSKSPCNIAVFLLEGKLSFNSKNYEKLSYFMLPSGEIYEDFNAIDNCKVLLVGWSQTETIKFDLI